ncbi:MAG: hypothetical protein H7301_10165 [Cryobacterium sp.]|nr:hypothetical protein [Oligoflexia bacterium]
MRESQSEIHSVRTDLEPASVIETPAGRKLASLTGSHPEGPTESESRKWLKWSEKELKQAQWARDALENDRVGRKGLPALGEATLSFVSFHGYVTQGKWRKAYLALEKAEIGVSLASETVCGRP